MRFFWIFIGIIAAVVVVSVVLNALFVHSYYPTGSYPYYGMMGYWGSYGPFWGFGALMMLIPLALLVLFIRWMVGIPGNHHGHDHFGWHDGDALEILNRRYANGSITQEEYNRMKEEITKK
jgi:putative membrane protein